MTAKRFTLVLVLLALLTAGVSAHDSDSMDAPRKSAIGLSVLDEIVLEATGLEAVDLRAALADGATIVELIEANEGDVAAVIADVTARMTEDINANATAIVESLEEQVSEELNASHSRRGPWRRIWHRAPRLFAYAGAGDALMEATGLDAADLRSSLRDGATIAELIEANGGDVESVAADIVAIVTDEVNAAAAERIESLEENITDIFNSDLADRWRRGRRGPVRPRFFFGFWAMSGAPANEQPAG
ncbi:MAG: hypothetical protein OXG78_04605 [Chloroflexi bacterium]|nr:hypothetical protein [Chloroflexota bacterium]